MTTKEILIAARKKIEKPENWCQFAVAETKYGCEVSPRCESACKWCSFGAIESFLLDHPTHQLIGAVHALVQVMAGPIGNFNDTHTHAEVLAAFDKAIEACKE